MKPMVIDDLDPGLRDAFLALPPLPLHSRLFRAAFPYIYRFTPAPKIKGAQRRAIAEIRGSRLFTPDRRKSDSALLWIHGGGYITGVAKTDDAFCAEVCRELGIVVLSVEYRTAPRHPFPAPLDDCHEAWLWLLSHAEGLGIDPARVAIGGISAGGGLAAALVQRVHDGLGPGAKAQWLLAPMLDDRTAARRELDPVRHFLWDNALNALGWRSYLGQSPGAPATPPYAVPARRDDLSGLPPAWVGTGEIEVFRDEDVHYAERLREAGCDVTLEVVPGAPHGFEFWAARTDIARVHLRKGREWLAGKLAA